MIGTIRKHSGWLWWIIATLTIVSFVYWGVSPASRYGNGGPNGLGTLYGKPVTPEQFELAKREFMIAYWMRAGQFPLPPAVTSLEIEQNVYQRLLLEAKAADLGVHVTDDAAADEAKNFLASMSRQGQTVSLSAVVERVFEPMGLTAVDFKRTIQSNLAIQQLAQSLGLAGALVPPQEAVQLYEHDHQEFSAQAVFFSATNYAAAVPATPAFVDQFYTNHMAEYRLPDRVQLNYVTFELSNYLATTEARLGKTNVDAEVDAIFAQHGLEAVPEAKTPEEAKAKIHDALLRQEAGKTALEEARQFARTLFAIEKADANTLLLLARTNGLRAQTTAPFSEADGPDEIQAPAELVKTAFKLSPESPFGPRPIAGTEAIYVIALAKQLPSEVQPLAEIHARVVADFKNFEGVLQARAVGTNFYQALLRQVNSGKTFAQAAVAAGQAPIALQPFSLSTRDIPEADEHNTDVREILYTAAKTQPGHLSSFMPTTDGGFILFVQSMLPVDEAQKTADMPKFVAQIRQSRQNEAFNRWFTIEANREFVNTPIPKELEAQKTSSRGQ